MKKELDCRTLACPSPVIMTKKELEAMEEGQLIVMVDNHAAKENVSRLIGKMGFNFDVSDKGNDEFHIAININGKEITEEGNNEEIVEVPNKKTIAISSSIMGSGSEELGKILMKSFIYTVRETEPYPNSILFYNEGVLLTTEGSEVLEDIIFLQKQGVEISSCGTCLDYYGIKDKLMVGNISNMYDIYESMRNANTINIS